MGNRPEIRRAELERIRDWFPARGKILEVGGGSGWQASILAGWGFDVTSIDIPKRDDPARHFPVIDYDGSHMPFRDGVFDAVFTSNVLEHIEDLEVMFSEMNRVAAVDGVFLHVMPSASWRLWTSLAHYFHLGRAIILRMARRTHRSGAIGADRGRARSYVKRVLSSGPHGANRSSFSELSAFSARRWKNVFARHGYRVLARRTNQLFYSGYAIFTFLSPAQRTAVARLLGSSANMFLLRRAGGRFAPQEDSAR